MSDKVVNPKDRFSRGRAELITWDSLIYQQPVDSNYDRSRHLEEIVLKLMEYVKITYQILKTLYIQLPIYYCTKIIYFFYLFM